MSELGALLRRQLVDGLQSWPRRVAEPGRTATMLDGCVTVADLRRRAARRVPRVVFDFVDGGAGDEVTATRNVADFDRYALAPRVLVDVSRVDISTTVLGQPVRTPILGAPTGLTGLVHGSGELGIARAVLAAGGIYALSTMASYSLEEIAAGAPGPKWFQVYGWRDRGLVADLLARAAAHGYQALMLTVDVPVIGARHRDRRNGFGIPPRLTARTVAGALRRPGWTADFVRNPRTVIESVAGRAAPVEAVSLADYVTAQFDPSLSWADVAWIREEWEGPLVIKGIMRPEDARRAVDAGAQGVAVSNHGGRQLDGADSAIEALPGVVDAVGGDAEVFVDGGIRRGSHVAIALAQGARAVLAGRALVYGLGAAGEAGAARAMSLLSDELALTLGLLGCPSLGELDRSWLSRRAA
jgi:isopentenyl diphosphate isomerase/L-lactate dehydrogenase-like FMN-dependent dehydrogenase